MQIVEIVGGSKVVQVAVPTLIQTHQPLRIGEWQGPDECRVHDGEDSGGCPNTEAERQDHGDRKHRSVANRANRVAQVFLKILEPQDTLALVKALFHLIDVPEPTPRGALRIGIAQTLLPKAVGFDRDMRLDLGGKVSWSPTSRKHAHALPASGPRTCPIATAVRRHRLVA